MRAIVAGLLTWIGRIGAIALLLLRLLIALIGSIALLLLRLLLLVGVVRIGALIAWLVATLIALEVAHREISL
jgi:hypothetical protein